MLVERDTIDATERIEEYEKGKTLTCDCGQGIGVGYGTKSVKCADCNSVLVDHKAGDRGGVSDDGDSDKPEDNVEQTGLGDFM